MSSRKAEEVEKNPKNAKENRVCDRENVSKTVQVCREAGRGGKAQREVCEPCVVQRENHVVYKERNRKPSRTNPLQPQEKMKNEMKNPESAIYLTCFVILLGTEEKSSSPFCFA